MSFPATTALLRQPDRRRPGGPEPGGGVGPCFRQSAIRRVLQDLDPADLNTRVRSWFYTRTGTIEDRRVIAADGRTMRGARTNDAPTPHLLSALDQDSGTVLTQQRVADKSNQRSPPSGNFSNPSTWNGAVVSADATVYPA